MGREVTPERIRLAEPARRRWDLSGGPEYPLLWALYDGSPATAISVNGMQTGGVVTDGTDLNKGNVVPAG